MAYLAGDLNNCRRPWKVQQLALYSNDQDAKPRIVSNIIKLLDVIIHMILY